MICFICLLLIIIKNVFDKEIDPAICDKLTILGSIGLIEFFIEFSLCTYFFD